MGPGCQANKAAAACPLLAMWQSEKPHDSCWQACVVEGVLEADAQLQLESQTADPSYLSGPGWTVSCFQSLIVEGVP